MIFKNFQLNSEKMLSFFNKKRSFSTYPGMIFIAFFFLLQYLLFRQFIFREILPIYPMAHDQVGYFNQTYELFQAVQIIDWHAIINTITTYHTGVLLQGITSLGYVFFGPSREVALTVNFLFFLFLQIYQLRFSKKMLSSFAGFFYFCGMIIALPTIYYFVGGMFDYRLDFAAFCLNFLVIEEIIIYLKTKEKNSFLILTFFLTALFYTRTYNLIVYCLVGFLLFVFFFLTKKLKAYKLIFASLLIAYILAFPYFFANLKNLYNYYYIGHVSGKEKEYRKEESKTQNEIDSLLYYPKTLFDSHLKQKQALFILIQSIIFLTFIIGAKKNKNKYFLDELCVIVIFFITFLTVYTMDTSKSPVVGMNLAIYVLMLLFLLYINFSAILKSKGNIIYLIAGFVFLAGSYFSFKQFNISLGFSSNYQYKNVGKMMEYVNQKVNEYRINSPIIAAFYNNELSDRLAIYYQAYDNNKLTPYKQYLGNSLGWHLDQVSIDKARSLVLQSNIVFYNLGDWEINWIPFNKNYKEIRNGSKDIVEKYFCKEGPIFDLPWGKVQIYLRPMPLVSATNDDWIIDGTNISLTNTGSCLNKFSKIVLIGKNNRTELKKYNLKIEYYINDNQIGETELELANSEKKYHIEIPLKINSQLPDRLIMKTNNYLVPCKISASTDCRRLFFFRPDETQIN